MGAVQSTLFAFTAIALARMYMRRAVNPEPISAGVAHGSDSGSGMIVNVPSDVERVASTSDPEPTLRADGEWPSAAAAALTPPAIKQPLAAGSLAPSELALSKHTLDIINNNPNVNEVFGPANIVNSNPNLLLSSSPGAIVNYNLNANFLASVPDPLDVIQNTIAAALKERHVPKAAFDSQLGKGCMIGTRVQVLQSIENWILDLTGQQIFWLAGMAGAGKTAIAQTVCWRVREGTNIVLGGSFFCSRSTGSAAQRDVRCVVPTLAQLFARQSKEFSEALAAELKRDPDILHKQVDVQIKQLLYTPLRALEGSLIPILFVIDALDECGDQPTEADSDNTESHLIVSEMLEALVDFSRESAKLPVKFLVTSRPETHIRDTPVSDVTFSSVLHLHTVNKEQVTADIRLYIDRRLFSSTKLCAHLTDVDVDMLARLSDGLFIVAETALKHILAKGIDAAASRFNTLLNSAQDGLSSRAAAPLDRMYRFILDEAAGAGQADTDELQELLNLLASLLSARMTLSVAALSDLIGVPSVDVRARLSRLHAVVYVPDEDHEPNLRTLHASFGDYLLGRASGSVCISASLGHDLLSRGCLRVMATRLHFNVSQSRSSHVSNEETRPKTITLSLEYACLQWIRHVAVAPAPAECDAEIYAVFRPRFLFWLEVMSVLGHIWHAAALLFIAYSTVSLPELSKFFRDANAFVTSSYQAIKRSAPHIYLSALPFAPKDSLVYQAFAPHLTGLISVETFGIDRHGGRLVMTLTGHQKGVTSIAYSSDGHSIASGSEDGTVRIWDTRTGEEVMSPMRSGDREVRSVAFSPNGKSVAAGTEACVVCIWSLRSGQAHLQRLTGHSGAILSVAFSPDGAILVSASADHSLRVWREDTGDQLAVLDGHTDKVMSVAFAPNGETIASGSWDQTIRLWHVATCRPVGQPLTTGDAVQSLCFSPDGEKLLSTLGNSVGWIHPADSGRIYLWDPKTRTVCLTLRGHTRPVRCARFSSDGRSVVSASDDRTVRVWTVPQNTADVSSIVLDGQTDQVCSALFSSDGLYIALASDDCTITIWDAGNGQQVVQPLPAHETAISSIAVSPCGSFIVSVSDDCSVRVWDMQTGQPRLDTLLRRSGRVTSVTISSDGRLIASTSWDTIRLWDARTGEAVGDPLSHEDEVNAVAFSSNTRWLASSDHRTVRMWDVATRHPSNIAPLRCADWVDTVGFSPDGRLLAAGDHSGRIHLWHTNTGQSVCEPLHEIHARICSIAFTPDGARIVAGGDDNMIRVWDVNTRHRLLLLEGHSDHVLSVAVSSDGDFICSGSDDRTLRLWSAATGMAIATLHGHDHYVSSVAFAPDGRSVVSCSSDKTIRVWNVDAARVLTSSHASDPAATIASATLDDGWLVGPSRELLVWVPEKYRAYLQRYSCSMVIGQRRIVVTIGDDGWHHGTNWTSCWPRDTFSTAPHAL